MQTVSVRVHSRKCYTDFYSNPEYLKTKSLIWLNSFANVFK